MRNRSLACLLAACACLAGHGCTARAWYEGLQERERQACHAQANPRDAQDCLDRVDRLTYDQYRKAREDAAGRPR
jgi:hypothetical protein